MSSSCLVIGAGIIGLSIADALASRGVRVTVLDRRSPGRGASQASAGILAPFTEAIRHGPLLDLGRRSLVLYDDFIASVGERSGRAIDYDRSGTLEVALTDDERKHLVDAKAWLDVEGEPAEWVEGAAVRSLEPAVTLAAHGALLVRRHGFVGVASLGSALLAAARLSGAVFEDGVDVTAIEPGATDVAVKTRDGRQYLATTVVVAAGSWAGQIRIRGAAAPSVRPIRGQLLHVRAPQGARTSRVVWGTQCYTVPWSDGSVLVGATVEDAGFDERATVGGVLEMCRAVTALLPGYAQAAVEAIRVGLRPQAPDGMPLVGPHPDAPGVIMATGHYRNGILLAPLTAQIVVEQVTGGRSGDFT